MEPALPLCACGCGRAVLPRLPQIAALRDQGLSWTRVGWALDIHPDAAKHDWAKRLHPPRFLRGHSSHGNHAPRPHSRHRARLERLGAQPLSRDDELSLLILEQAADDRRLIIKPRWHLPLQEFRGYRYAVVKE